MKDFRNAVVLLAITSGGVCSANAQSGWFPLNSGTTTNLNSVNFPTADTGFAVGDGGLILRTTDGGDAWEPTPSGVSDDLNDAHFFTADTGVVVGDNGAILRSIDAGLTWATVASGVVENLYCVSFDCDQPTGIAGGSSQTILRSTDRGRSWIVVQTGFFGGEFNGAHMTNPTTGMVAGENSIFQPLAGLTTDEGAGWEFHAFYLNGNEGQAEDVYVFGPATSVVVSSVWDGTGAISRTTNGGNDWSTTLVTEDLAGIDFGTPSVGYLVGSSGKIMKSTDSGVSWFDQNSGSSENLNEASFLDSVTGYAVGDNGAILKTTTGGVIVSVNPTADNGPFAFRLFANYPNPFNPTTHIKFEIPESGMTTIDVFNPLGEKVADVLDKKLAAGSYVVDFDANGMPGGVYFYRLRSGSFTVTKKMIHLK